MVWLEVYLVYTSSMPMVSFTRSSKSQGQKSLPWKLSSRAQFSAGKIPVRKGVQEKGRSGSPVGESGPQVSWRSDDGPQKRFWRWDQNIEIVPGIIARSLETYQSSTIAVI
ncbi:hypothetical protein HBI56_010780 [Parastagonospora nodorum]|nr:hypothetical protein HBI10_094560 [Parastagonospora nodorum]KAH4033494.1 hypothetical protein HBI13_011190 [Parastagonospora nodorum]KAH4167486.1 hypothetical protein HBH43_129000 [Parastagonospora nodorum]KAH4352895.1 hypothetical protein HBH98_026930 [Parastagonospora nodorum]KAH4387488.1 hypothetical protein HBH97_061360 [Parastagonospora nodorum]